MTLSAGRHERRAKEGAHACLAACHGHANSISEAPGVVDLHADARPREGAGLDPSLTPKIFCITN
jgi:hypothetical protein